MLGSGNTSQPSLYLSSSAQAGKKVPQTGGLKQQKCISSVLEAEVQHHGVAASVSF